MKRIYKTPQMKVVNVQLSQIVCTSDASMKAEQLEEEEFFEWDL